MSPSFSHGARGQVYRYYVSAPLQQGQRRKSDDSAIRRVPAPALEALLADLMTRRTPSSQADPLALLTRVEVHASSLQLLMPVRLLAPVRAGLGEGEQVEQDHEHPDQPSLKIPITLRLRGGRTEILGSAKPTVQIGRAHD